MPTPGRATDGARALWAIDPTHSTVEFSVKNLFLFTVKGSITIQGGDLVIDAADAGGSSVAVTLNASSINTGNNQRDAHLRAPNLLDADRYPEIHFQSTKVEPGSDRDTLRVTGLVTIKGSSREIVLDASDIDRSRSPGGEHVAYYTALAELDRHDFGINYMRGLIGRMVKIKINLQASRRG